MFASVKQNYDSIILALLERKYNNYVDNLHYTADIELIPNTDIYLDTVSIEGGELKFVCIDLTYVHTEESQDNGFTKFRYPTDISLESKYKLIEWLKNNN